MLLIGGWCVLGLGCLSAAELLPVDGPPSRLAHVKDVSGLVWHPGRKLFYAVSDNGRLYAIDGAGKVRSTWEGFEDAEGVTYGELDSPLVYVVRERPTPAIVEFDVDTGQIRRVFQLGRWIRPAAPNQGAEAITFVPGDQGGRFYVGVQDGTIHVLRLPRGNSGSSAEAEWIESFRPIGERDDIAGLDFDRLNRVLYVLWDRPDRLTAMDGRRRILQDWKMYRDEDPNQEGIAIDVERGRLFSVEDDSGQIYRFSGFEPTRAAASGDD